MKIINYARQHITTGDIKAVGKALRGDYLTQGGLVTQFEQELGVLMENPHVMVCNSGTAALHLAYKSLGLQCGDGIIVPAMTFSASANAAVLLGARVHFADVNPHNGLVELEYIQKAYNQNPTGIKGVCVVHLNGQLVNLLPIKQFCDEHGLWLVEDACHAIGGYYDHNQPVGKPVYSDAICFSFHPAKTITTGEGGAVSFANDQHNILAKQYRSHGIIRTPNDPWHYDIGEIFTNYRLPDINCALGLSQLQKLTKFTQKRQRLVAIYRRKLQNNPILQPINLNGFGQPAWHLMAVQLHDGFIPQKMPLLHQLRERGVMTQVHYIPVNQLAFYKKMQAVECPNAQIYYQKTFSLPLYPLLKPADIDHITGILNDICHGLRHAH